jgi:transposase-like protein
MRWTPKRKAEVIEAIQNGRLTPVEAMARHELSEEELAAWMRDLLAYGKAGLRSTMLQHYRSRSRLTIGEANGHRLQEPGQILPTAPDSCLTALRTDATVRRNPP